jgi:CDGSH-type Zn-finger protein/uncharacterized Fe-S cluster protein YjdI
MQTKPAGDPVWSEFTKTARSPSYGSQSCASTPEVFQPEGRPWVKVDAATAEKIAEVVMTCPTGALHFERLDGGPQEPQPEETTINARPNSPLYMQGKMRIPGPGGQLIREDTRLALCRCGHSGNKPVCDGSRRRVGFPTSTQPESSG